jgi:UDPglucose 6-dehydrogenase
MHDQGGMMNICVIGTGYVGLVAGTCFAENGNEVICIDNDSTKIANLKQGLIPIYEPGLTEMVKRNTSEGRLQFTTDLALGVRNSLVIFIAVGTPSSEDGSADLSFVEEVARGIGRAMNGYKVVVNKSTVPIGTADRVRHIIRTASNQEFDMVSNPEFLKEGAALEDFLKPDRVVIGSDNPRAEKIMKELYSPFVRTEKPIICMDIKSAEMTKYASNAMLALKISFINQIANLCERVGADVFQVRKGMGSDSRIGYQFLFPGVGYGGSCFPKDVKALIRTATEHGYDLSLIKTVESVNQAQKKVLMEKVMRHFDGNVQGRKLAIWGLAFKPRTDDMREAPSIVIINHLLAQGAHIAAFDPEASKEAQKIFGNTITICRNPYDALEEADALIIVTEWNEFRKPNFEKIASLLRFPVIFDGRNIYDPEEVKSLGFTYYAIGRRI